MKKLMVSLKTSLILFGLVFFLTPPSIYADDIEIYGDANSMNPAVNVLFIFDLSGSMNLNMSGTDWARNTGENSRYEILQKALTNVLADNKEIANLRVGLSWFSEYSSGIRWPITGIRDDIHSRDTAIPAGTYKTWEYLPEAFRSFYNIDDDWRTKMVPSLLEAAYYFRGDDVWRGARKPQLWDESEKRFIYNNAYSAHHSSYTPSKAALASPYPEYRGTKAYAKYPFLYTTTENCNNRPVDGAHPLPAWCHNNYNSPTDLDNYGINKWRMNVRDCDTRTAKWTSQGGYCNVAEEHYQCTEQPDNAEGGPTEDICVCPPGEWTSGTSSDYTQHYCTFDYAESEAKWLGAKYNTPIDATCTPSYIVLLSDGAPTLSSMDTLERIKTMTGVKSCAKMDSAVGDGTCGPELMEYMANNDMVPNLAGSKVFTYTIGFNVAGAGKNYLELLADKGNGVFYPASQAADLEKAFNKIIETIAGENESFTGLVTSIRASTLSSDNRVYMNMFKPGNTQSWAGNTKSYFIGSDGLLDVYGDPAVENIDGIEKFKGNARSCWSNTVDGNFVDIGGASGNLQAGSRNIYTYLDANAPSNSSLIAVSKPTISATDVTVADDNERDELIDWLYDSKMADPLHAKPILIRYDGKDVLYSMTNQGLLHAFDATHPLAEGDTAGGEEIFAFIPKALLPNLKRHKSNTNSSDHLYGLDGSVSFYHKDDDDNRVVNGGEKVYLYFGMRRGGKNYYALDVSDYNSPKLAWQIIGGAGDYTQLGQTWSRMVPTTVKWGVSTKKVLIFAGGYDEDQDNHTGRTNDDEGNIIFMVDAVDGTLLWKGMINQTSDANNKSYYSIPSNITVIDSDSDGITDRLYVGDMGGQVWRVDLVDSDNNVQIHGYRLAKLGSDDANENRRFYSAPSVAKVKGSTGFYYAITIGSGFRAHPLSTTVQDYIYMLKDVNVAKGSHPYVASILPADLYDVTENIIGQGSGGTAEEIEAAKTAAKTVLDSKKGWQLKLEEPGEKSLSPSLIFDYKIAFSTFTPASSQEENDQNEVCNASGGNSRFYLVNLEDATPVKDLDDETDTILSNSHRYTPVPGSGIPPETAPYFPPNTGKVDLYVGKHKVTNMNNGMVRSNWKVIK